MFATGRVFEAQAAEVNYRRGPGSPVEQRYLTFIYSPLTDDDGRISGVFCEGFDVTDQARGEQTQRAANLRQAVLVDLADRFRDLGDPADLSYAAAELLGTALQVSRAGYGTIDPRRETIEIERDWNAPGIRSLAGLLHFRDYGSYIEELKRGVTVVITDSMTDPRTADVGEALKGINAQALVNMPVTEQGGFVALLYLNHDEARTWTEDELTLIREVAERTRMAVERRRAEEDLRTLAASLEQQVAERTADRDRVWRNSRDLLVVIGADGVFRAVNPAWTRILGHDPADVVGRSFLEFVWPEDAILAQGGLDTAVARHDLNDFENRYTHRDGAPRWISWQTSVEGEVVFAYGRDITAQKAAQAELAEAQEALRQSQKMEAVGQLTGGLAHDFNNLLMGISGSLELLEKRLGQGRIDVERYISAAQGGARRAANLTQRLLAFSRRQTLDPRPIEPSRLIAGMADLIERSTGPDVELIVNNAPDLWLTKADASQLESALLNLCINARDAMAPKGGALLIETSNRRFDTRSGELKPGQYVAIAIIDTGAGMPADVAARAFEPFFTTKPRGEGTGLGLSMVYGFVRQSGGQVRIDSEEGQGTTVTLYLPRFVGEIDEDPAQEEARIDPAAGETVLVIDDEETIRALLRDVLEEAGYAVLEAPDGPKGLEILQSSAAVDLLITDVGLPGGVNGRQVADAARLRRPGLKTLFITGFAENAAVSSDQLETGMEVITKPFAMSAMAQKVREMLDQ
ncbi:MAG: ATP-binding protein [Caulobacteraceae bacterium]